MPRTLVKNSVVSMDWDAEGFYESKKQGTFIAATHIYPGTKGDVTVIFKDSKAFILIDDQGKPAVREDILGALKEANKEGISVEELYEDIYVELSNSVSLEEESLEYYGLSEADGQDILRRLEDLSGYWEVVYEDF